MIINCDTNLLASLMTSLVIKNKDEIKLIFDLALQLREQTPYSFRILANKLGFLKPNNQEVKKLYELYHPQSIPAMPIFPLELLSLTHKSGINCIDPECKNCKNKTLDDLVNDDYCIIDNEKEGKNDEEIYSEVYGVNHGDVFERVSPNKPKDIDIKKIIDIWKYIKWKKRF